MQIRLTPLRRPKLVRRHRDVDDVGIGARGLRAGKVAHRKLDGKGDSGCGCRARAADDLDGGAGGQIDAAAAQNDLIGNGIAYCRGPRVDHDLAIERWRSASARSFSAKTSSKQ